MDNRSFERQMNMLSDQIEELSDRLDKVSKALYHLVQYDSEYDQKIRDEIERIYDESKHNC